MWPFSPRNRQETPSKPPRSAGGATDWGAGNAISELEARVSQLTADLAGIRLEWADVLDKINRWASRQAARDRRRAAAELDGLEIAEDGPGATNGGGDGEEVAGELTGAQRAAVKAQLRARIPTRR